MIAAKYLGSCAQKCEAFLDLTACPVIQVTCRWLQVILPVLEVTKSLEVGSPLGALP
jgi:hypothetical protein